MRRTLAASLVLTAVFGVAVGHSADSPAVGEAVKPAGANLPAGRGSSDPLEGLSGGAKLHALVDAIVATQRSTQSLRSRFVQVKNSALLLEPVESRGSLVFQAPGQVRWVYDEPEPMVVLFDDEILTTYIPGQMRAERVKVSRKQRRFVKVKAGTQPLDELRSHFRITLSDPGPSAPYKLTLEPSNRVLQRKLQSVVLEVDRKLMLPVVVEYLEADGDFTRYEFSHIELNPGLAPDAFRLELGSDVRIDTLDAAAMAGG